MEILDIPQGEPDWFEARAGIPTASEFHRFITPARGQYAKQADTYIAKLIVESVLGPAEAMSTFYMDRGTVMEDEARSEYELLTDTDVEVPGLILNKGAGWSPDGYIPERRGGLEAKCPKPETHVKWLLAGCIPDEHKPQCHGAIIVGELDWLDFISYCPGFPMLLIRCIRDDYTTKVEQCLQQFLKEYHDAKQRIDDQIAA
jgi:hypothetical protein